MRNSAGLQSVGYVHYVRELICNLFLLLLFTEQRSQHHGVKFGVKHDCLCVADLQPCPYDIIN